MLSSLQIGLRWSSKVSGGAERVFADLAAALPGTGISFVGAVAGKDTLQTETSGLIHSFAAENASTASRLRGARRVLGQLLDAESPDLLASHFAMYTAPILGRLSERPFVMHFHGPWSLESSVEGASRPATVVKRWIEQAVYQRADRVIVLSEAFAALLHREYGIPEDIIRLIPGAVDLDRFKPTLSRVEAREQLGWPTDRPTLFSLRRLMQRMGLQQLIGAMSIVRKKVPDVLLCIGGTGPMRPRLQQQVQAQGLSGHVRFLGFVPDEAVPLAYRAADISVVPTLALEGFGLVAAESLAAGTPAMVTPIGGLPEVVGALSPDLIFASGETHDMATALISALRGDSLLPKETDCRDFAVSKFSRGLMAERIAAVYREVAE